MKARNSRSAEELPVTRIVFEVQFGIVVSLSSWRPPLWGLDASRKGRAQQARAATAVFGGTALAGEPKRVLAPATRSARDAAIRGPLATSEKGRSQHPQRGRRNSILTLRPG